MSPIIELQRRMVERGRIRAGDRTDKGAPRKLANWRLTSKDRQTLDEAAKLWGGKVREWEGHEGEFELYTETDALPIMLLPGSVPTTWYELWSKGGCQRRCDGVHETISDSTCLCGEDRECKPLTRLSVLLPDLPGLGSWLLSSTGWNAAAELAGAADLLQRASAQGVLIPARLRLEQRTQVTGGQTRKFAVPVIDIDLAFRSLLAGQGALSAPSEARALPAGYIPLPTNGGAGVSLADGLAAAETQTVTRTGRSAAPLPEIDDDIPFGEAPVPVADPEPPAVGNSLAHSTRDRQITKAKAEALDKLVGPLREEGVITTEQLWGKLAVARERDADELIAELGGYDEEGVLRWRYLRDALTRGEAERFHTWLKAVFAKSRDE